MKFSIATAIVAAAFALAACDRPDNPTPRSAATGSTQGPKDTSAVQTPNTPANLPKPTEAERERESNKPQQGQVDPKQSEQHRDFQRL
ncbi:MAG: hypothetical protein ACT4P4_15875 [Betaproteobacteria bacterium]